MYSLTCCGKVQIGCTVKSMITLYRLTIAHINCYDSIASVRGWHGIFKYRFCEGFAWYILVSLL